jgi:hypothetical protein
MCKVIAKACIFYEGNLCSGDLFFLQGGNAKRDLRKSFIKNPYF